MCVFFACVVVVTSGFFSARTGRQAALDVVNRPLAIVIREPKFVTPIIYSPGVLTLTFGYDRLQNCAWPLADPGDYMFRAYLREADSRYVKSWSVEPSLAAVEPPGVKMHASLNIEVKTLQPGHYRLRVRPVLNCVGENEPQILQPIWLDFDVLEPPAPQVHGFLPPQNLDDGTAPLTEAK